MSADWKPGDLAVCVDNTEYEGPLLREGATYEVLAVVPAFYWADGYYGAGLIIDGPHNPGSDDGDWGACRFRKVVSDKPEACEEEFLTLLKRSKRSVQA